MVTTTTPALAALSLRRGALDWRRPVVVGVVNVTPDSFSDGGRAFATEAAIARGRELAGLGADWIDVGGESTRPGAEPVSAAEELSRVLPVVEALAADGAATISVDTTKAEVAAACLAAGAEVVNDISGGLFDADMFALCAERGAAYLCGHVRGADLAAVHAAERPRFDEVCAELDARLAAMPPTLRARAIVDPCLGFGKGTRENLELIARAGELSRRLGHPVLIGPSRKRFLGELTGKPVGERDDATVGACLAAVAAGAQLLRVHDVARLVPALAAFTAAREAA